MRSFARVAAVPAPALAFVLALAPAGVTAQVPPRDAPAGDAPGYAPEIMAAAQHNVSEIRACYDDVSRRSHAVWRQVHSVSLVVNADGTVNDVVVAPSNAVTVRFRGCLQPIVRGWHLSPPAQHAAVTLTYPATELRLAIEQIQARR